MLSSSRWELFVTALIAINFVVLGIGSFTEPDTLAGNIFYWIQWAFVAIFALEAGTNILAFGFVGCRNAFVKIRPALPFPLPRTHTHPAVTCGTGGTSSTLRCCCCLPWCC